MFNCNKMFTVRDLIKTHVEMNSTPVYIAELQVRAQASSREAALLEGNSDFGPRIVGVRYFRGFSQNLVLQLTAEVTQLIKIKIVHSFIHIESEDSSILSRFQKNHTVKQLLFSLLSDRRHSLFKFKFKENLFIVVIVYQNL